MAGSDDDELRNITVGSEAMAELARTVAAARTTRKWTQAELASRVGVSVETISNLERGLHRPRNLPHILAVLREPDIDPETLVRELGDDVLLHLLRRAVEETSRRFHARGEAAPGGEPPLRKSVPPHLRGELRQVADG